MTIFVLDDSTISVKAEKEICGVYYSKNWRYLDFVKYKHTWKVRTN